MNKDVQIKIISMQHTDDGDDKQEMVVAGTVSHEDGVSFIEYCEDTEELGEEKTIITIKNGTEVSIIREGQFSSEMTVEDGKRHTTFYKTPYGEFTMGIYGNKVDFMRNEKESILKMKYTLDFNNGFISENNMNIYIDER